MVTYRPIDWIDWLPKNLYRVGDDGSVWVHHVRTPGHKQGWQQITPFWAGGRVCVNLNHNRVGNQQGVAKLVARAFHGPRPIGHIAYHFPNRDLSDCRASNVRWAPRGTANVGQPFPGGVRRGEDSPRAVLTEPQVLRMRRLYRGGWTFKEIADRFGVPTNTAMTAVVGKSWTHLPGAVTGSERAGTKGERNRHAKLIESEVIQIRTLKSQGVSARRLMEEFGVSKTVVYNILSGRLWKHVAGPIRN